MRGRIGILCAGDREAAPFLLSKGFRHCQGDHVGSAE